MGASDDGTARSVQGRLYSRMGMLWNSNAFSLSGVESSGFDGSKATVTMKPLGKYSSDGESDDGHPHQMACVSQHPVAIKPKKLWLGGSKREETLTATWRVLLIQPSIVLPLALRAGKD